MTRYRKKNWLARNAFLEVTTKYETTTLNLQLDGCCVELKGKKEKLQKAQESHILNKRALSTTGYINTGFFQHQPNITMQAIHSYKVDPE